MKNQVKAVYSERALMMVEQHLSGIMPACRRLSPEECLEDINMSSSAGLPTLWNKGSVLASKPLSRIWAQGVEQITSGLQLFYGFPKCELRTIEKEYVHGISAQSLGAYLVTVSYSKQWNSSFYRRFLEFGSCVGMPIQNGYWDRAARLLLRKIRGKRPRFFYCFDIKRANQSCPYSIVELEARLKACSLGVPSEEVLKVLSSAFHCVLVLPDGTHHFVSSLQSGDFNTTIRNTLSMLVFLAEFFLCLGIPNWTMALDLLNYLVFGDDGIMASYHDISWAFELAQRRTGIELTLDVFRTLEECHFLGHTFRKVSDFGSWYVPLPEDLTKVWYQVGLDKVRKDGSNSQSHFQMFSGLVSQLRRLCADVPSYLAFQKVVLACAAEWGIGEEITEYRMALVSPQSAVRNEFLPVLTKSGFSSFLTAHEFGSGLKHVCRIKLGAMANGNKVTKKAKKASKKADVPPAEVLRRLKQSARDKRAALSAKRSKGAVSSIQHSTHASLNTRTPWSGSGGMSARSMDETLGRLSLYNGGKLGAGFIIERGDDNRLLMHVRQPVYEITCSQDFHQGQRFFDVDDNTLFPRAANICGLFKQWRPINMKLSYTALCPAVRTGRIQAFWDPDPEGDTPSTIQEVALQPMAIIAPVWENTESRMLMMDRDFSNDWKYTGDASAPNTDRFFGRFIFQSMESSSSDADTNAGIFFLSTTLELMTAAIPIGSSLSLKKSVHDSIPASGSSVSSAEILSGITKLGNWRSGDFPFENNEQKSNYTVNLIGATKTLLNNEKIDIPSLVDLIVHGRTRIGEFSSGKAQVGTGERLQLVQSSETGPPLHQTMLLSDLRVMLPVISRRIETDEALLDWLERSHVTRISGDKVFVRNVNPMSLVSGDVAVYWVHAPKETLDVITSVQILSNVGSGSGILEWDHFMFSGVPQVASVSIASYEARDAAVGSDFYVMTRVSEV